MGWIQKSIVSSQNCSMGHIMPFVRVCSFASFIMLFAFATLIGCGPSGPVLVDIRGKVTLDGKPLDRAYITFEPANGRASVGETNDQGEYRLQYTNDEYGALLGKHTVRITSLILFTEGGDKGRPELLPKRFHEKSELTKDVDRNSKVFNFDLTSK